MAGAQVEPKRLGRWGSSFHFEPMMRPPQRISLVAQTIATLKEHIASCSGGQRLASERELCRQLGVSRVTLRSALAKLQDEKLIEGQRGRRRVIRGEKAAARVRVAGRDVVLLSPFPLEEVEPRVLFWIDELRQVLAKEGFELNVMNQPACYLRRPEKQLEELAGRLRPSAWVLLLSTREMQEWFQARRLPAVIAGSCYEGVRLPAMDMDYQAACRHAVSRFLAKGHRSLALLHPRSVLAGGLRTQAGFCEAGAAAGPQVRTVVAQHDGTVGGICAALDRLLASNCPPTGFLVCRPGDALTALGHLIRRGLRFPEQAGLISRDHDWFLELVIPSVARYRMEPAAFAHRLSRIVLDLTSGGNPPAREFLIMPRFIGGESLG